MDETKRMVALRSAKPLPAFLAVSEPSLLMTTSELLIMSKLCPDRILPSRSGTGAASASGSGLKVGMLLLQVSEGLQFLYSYSTCSTNTHYIQKKPTSRASTEVSQGGSPVACIRVTQSPETSGTQMLSTLFTSGAHCTALCVSLCRVSRLTFQGASGAALKRRPLSVIQGYLHPSCLSSLTESQLQMYSSGYAAI